MLGLILRRRGVPSRRMLGTEHKKGPHKSCGPFCLSVGGTGLLGLAVPADNLVLMLAQAVDAHGDDVTRLQELRLRLDAQANT